MSYSEPEPDSNFSINSASNFDSFSSESQSESDFSSVFMNPVPKIPLKPTIRINFTNPTRIFPKS